MNSYFTAFAKKVAILNQEMVSILNHYPKKLFFQKFILYYYTYNVIGRSLSNGFIYDEHYIERCIKTYKQTHLFDFQTVFYYTDLLHK